VLGQPDFGSSSGAVPAPERIGRPTALVSDGKNLFVGDAAAHRVLMFTAADFSLSEKSVLNSATRTHVPLAPGTLVTIEGENLAVRAGTAKDDGESSLPDSLAGIEVLLNGGRLPLLSVSPDEIRCQIPYDLNGAESGTLAIRDEPGAGAVAFSNAVAVEFRSASPGILAFAGTEPRAGMLVHVNSGTGGASNPVTVTEPARPGQPVVLWASGLGSVIDADGIAEPVAGAPYPGEAGNVLTEVRAEIDGQSVQVVSAILPHGSIGVYQVQIVLPRELSPKLWAHLTLSQGEAKSNTVTLPIGNPVQ